jgi:hypothetical protein
MNSPMFTHIAALESRLRDEELKHRVMRDVWVQPAAHTANAKPQPQAAKPASLLSRLMRLFPLWQKRSA